MCIICHGDQRKKSNQCPTAKLIQRQQSEKVRSAFASVPTPVSHRSAPISVSGVSKAAIADAVIIYAGHVCSGSADIFQNVLDHFLQRNDLPSFSIGDCPPLSLTGIPNATSFTDPAPFHGNRMTAYCRLSETTAADVDFAACASS